MLLLLLEVARMVVGHKGRVGRGDVLRGRGRGEGRERRVDKGGSVGVKTGREKDAVGVKRLVLLLLLSLEAVLVLVRPCVLPAVLMLAVVLVQEVLLVALVLVRRRRLVRLVFPVLLLLLALLEGELRELGAALDVRLEAKGAGLVGEGRGCRDAAAAHKGRCVEELCLREERRLGEEHQTGVFHDCFPGCGTEVAGLADGGRGTTTTRDG